jgi:hypothetical protein
MNKKAIISDGFYLAPQAGLFSNQFWNVNSRSGISGDFHLLEGYELVVDLWEYMNRKD